MSKIGLVLEGGGMRGAYTAGCLCWLIDNEIEFDYGVGISAGAMNLCSYAMKNKTYLYDVMVKYMADKRNVGRIPLMKEGTYVGYNFMFDDLLSNIVKYELTPLKTCSMEVEIGIYDLEAAKTVWVDKSEMDLGLRLLKGACTLPIAGKIVDYNHRRYIDGGVTTMVPVDRSIRAGCDKHFVIITKDEGYVRKPAGKLLLGATRFCYPKYPALLDNLRERTDVYYREMGEVEQMVENKTAVLFRPTKHMNVKRFSGDPVALQQLFELGYQDLEARREEIFEFVKK